MKSFRQYIEEAINYDSLELDNDIIFKLRNETKNIQIPLTPKSEKKLKTVWNDWKDILTINGEIGKLQKLSKKTALSAYLKRYVVITKADLSSQKSYEDKLSDKSSHKQMPLGPDSRKRVGILKTDGISSLEIISIPNSKVKVPVFKTLDGSLITPIENNDSSWLDADGLVHVIRIAKLTSKKKFLGYLESGILNDLVGEMVRMEKGEKLMELLGPKFKNWKQIVFNDHKEFKNTAWSGHLIRGADKLIGKELGTIDEKDIIKIMNSLIKKYAPLDKTQDLEKYIT
jgi:hypothetical protein|tara:strand:- start:409 stop:1266 length:858 start_codon:yes stop_codon:yes gene_type:complete